MTRRSIAAPTTVRGEGLHTGAQASATFQPGEPNTGILFQRVDRPGLPRIPAMLEAVQPRDRQTVLGDGDGSIATVEHALAAVAAHGIDDVLIELTGPELPIADGSAAPYFEALGRAGMVEREGTPRCYTVTHPFVVREADATYLVGPKEELRLTVTIEWDHPAIGRQSGSYDITPATFGAELAPARTFGFLEEADQLRQAGLIRGASKSNSIALSATEVVGTTLRWPDEFVRHKAVDLVGDLALLGGRCQADIVAFRPSHRGNLALARAIQRATMAGAPAVMGIERILEIIPHRYPMLLVDRIIEIEAGKRIVGIKNVTINEPFFQGHFPGHPIMPGVLIVEAMAQVGGMLLLGAVDDPKSKVVYFMAIDGVKFRRPVTPGDQIRFELEMLQFRGKTCRMRGVGYVEGRPVAEAEMMARIVDR